MGGLIKSESISTAVDSNGRGLPSRGPSAPGRRLGDAATGRSNKRRGCLTRVCGTVAAVGSGIVVRKVVGWLLKQKGYRASCAHIHNRAAGSAPYRDECCWPP